MGEQAIRVIPYLKEWQVFAIIAIIALLFVAVLILAGIKRAISDQPDRMRESIISAMKQLISEKKEEEDEKSLIAEFGPLSEYDRNFIKARGIDSFRASWASRKQKTSQAQNATEEASNSSKDEDFYTLPVDDDELRILRTYGKEVLADIRRKNQKRGKEPSSSE